MAGDQTNLLSKQRNQNIRRLSGTCTAELHRPELQTNRLRAEQEKIEAHLVEVWGNLANRVYPDGPLPDNAKKEIEHRNGGSRRQTRQPPGQRTAKGKRERVLP